MTGPKGRVLLDKRVSARSQGRPWAPLWIVEFTDFQCPACRQAASMMEDYLSRHPSEIFFQVRYSPLLRSRRYALKSALYADCAAEQKKFWEFHDLLFDRQLEWSASEDPDALFREYAWTAGVDRGRLEACVADPRTKQRVITEKDESIRLGVAETPTFFINGKRAVGTEALRRELENYF